MMDVHQPVLLIVQRDREFSAAAATVAGQCGYTPHLLENALNFSYVYEDTRPAVILMELFMPEFDGIEMVNWLVERQSRSRVLMTAKRNPEWATPAILSAEAKKLFTVSLLPQPVSAEQLEKELRRA